jgi:hypothetical protein
MIKKEENKFCFSSSVPFHRIKRLDTTGTLTHVTYLELTTSPAQSTGDTEDNYDEDGGNDDDYDDGDDDNISHSATATSWPGPPHCRGLTIKLRHITLSGLL